MCLLTLLDAGMDIVACNNLLNSNGVDRSALLPGGCVVPSGVMELVKKLRAGFAHIRL